ncbi:MAG: hypothetical protein EON51_15045 [Acinetobacter sp.]|nr:MAG: hypothetical protein EON51_15045 [Acinetobacter sp.]
MPQQLTASQYKYREDHASLDCDCPIGNGLSDYLGVAFRFVHEETTHPNCSLPITKIRRVPRTKNCKKDCGGYALSFYVTLDQAKARHKFLTDSYPVFKQTVGEHIAECNLTAADGKREAIGTDGHFNFHEFEGTDFTHRFENAVAAQL